MSQGSIGIKPVECINPRLQKWRVRWNIQPETGTDEIGEQQAGVTFEETEFSHKPTIDEIKALVIDWLNKQIDNQIVSGFTWNGIPVWLSTENQFNYKAAFDLAIQTNGQTLPVKFKLSDGNYAVFETIDSLTDFYMSAMAYIQATLDEGWKVKDNYDFTLYESELKDL